MTEDQMMTVKAMTEFAQVFLDQIETIVLNSGLDKIEGFQFEMAFKPEYDMVAKQIEIGKFTNMSENKPFGYCRLSARLGGKEYAPLFKNSAEYEYLFAHPAIRARIKAILDSADHPLPPDGMWVGASSDDHPVDRGELSQDETAE